MNFSELNVYLIKGLFYKRGRKTYIVGAGVPCISNVWACEVNKDGDLVGDIDALYYRQKNNWKLLKKDIVIKDKHKELLQELLCSDYHRTSKSDLPIVYQYLECYRINTIKKCAISKGDENVDDFMKWVKENCKYYAKYNQLIYYNPFTNHDMGCKSDEELYSIYKNQTSEY